ncbi:hypothetical protein ACFPL7_09500 [Dongia soli]|uniref:Secreted protein n=1 Tax=Dongia soli TaxID=600628 RepID=A0ABU5EA14_9PROT|nr:hypothetical protein [Dongia soli]MDY0883182.1 hypothetical protein [Dongia soli]
MNRAAGILLVTLLALLLILPLAACQSGSPEADTAAQQSETSHDARYFAAEYDAVTRVIGEELAENCQQSGAVPAMQKCFRVKLVQAFATPAEGQRACAPLMAIDPYVECISMGSLAADMRSKIPPSNRPEMQSADWRKPQPFLKKLVKGFAIGVINVCVDRKTETRSCIRQEMPRQLEIVQPLRQRCEKLSDDGDYSECIGEAMGLQFFHRAAVRLSMRDA